MGVESHPVLNFRIRKSIEMLEVIESMEEVENLYKTGHNAPYQPLEKGLFGYLGVLICHKKTGLVQCHLCGAWKTSLPPHLKWAHSITAEAYRRRFGFPLRFPLCSADMSYRMSRLASARIAAQKNKPWLFSKIQMLRRKGSALSKSVGRKTAMARKTPSFENEHNLCPDQILRRVTVVADCVGRFPSFTDMQRHDTAVATAICRRYGSWNKFKKANFPKEQQRTWQGEVWSADQVLFAIRKWTKEHRRAPQARDFNKKDKAYPSTTTIVGRFGSWNRALHMAGLG